MCIFWQPVSLSKSFWSCMMSLFRQSDRIKTRLVLLALALIKIRDGHVKFASFYCSALAYVVSLTLFLVD